jgi:hypothetical protein
MKIGGKNRNRKQRNRGKGIARFSGGKASCVKGLASSKVFPNGMAANKENEY